MQKFIVRSRRNSVDWKEDGVGREDSTTNCDCPMYGRRIVEDADKTCHGSACGCVVSLCKVMWLDFCIAGLDNSYFRLYDCFLVYVAMVALLLNKVAIAWRLCVCVCQCVCMCVCMCMFAPVSIRKRLCLYECICAHACTCECMCACVRVCAHICFLVCMFVPCCPTDGCSGVSNAALEHLCGSSCENMLLLLFPTY
jgi:hypothetical protein